MNPQQKASRIGRQQKHIHPSHLMCNSGDTPCIFVPIIVWPRSDQAPVEVLSFSPNLTKEPAVMDDLNQSFEIILDTKNPLCPTPSCGDMPLPSAHRRILPVLFSPRFERTASREECLKPLLWNYRYLWPARTLPKTKSLSCHYLGILYFIPPLNQRNKLFFRIPWRSGISSLDNNRFSVFHPENRVSNNTRRRER